MVSSVCRETAKEKFPFLSTLRTMTDSHWLVSACSMQSSSVSLAEPAFRSGVGWFNASSPCRRGRVWWLP